MLCSIRYDKYLEQGPHEVNFVSTILNPLALPVKIVWKAVSTLEVSRAEVSINDNPFSAVKVEFSSEFSQEQIKICKGEVHTRKCLSFFSRYSTKMLQIALITNQHNNNIRIRMVTQFFKPSRYVYISRMLRDVVNE